MTDDLYRLEAIVHRLEAVQRADHDDLVAAKILINEYRLAHTHLHDRDTQQLGKDFVELQRRLDVLNHAHEEARRKESDFASRSDMAVATDDLIRRIDNVQAAVGICLPRETFDAFTKVAREDDLRRDDQIAGLFTQVQGIAQNTQGNVSGTDRSRLLTFQLLSAFGVLIALVSLGFVLVHG